MKRLNDDLRHTLLVGNAARHFRLDLRADITEYAHRRITTAGFGS